MTLNDRLAHAITEHDRKQSRKRSYNPNALGIMLGALSEAQQKIDSGMLPAMALRHHFNDRLLDALLKVIA